MPGKRLPQRHQRRRVLTGARAPLSGDLPATGGASPLALGASALLVANGFLARRISRGLPYHFDHRRLRVLLRETFDPVGEFDGPVKGE
ncbi:MAG: hypothetical protein WKF95_04840 [Rubrobacter sp.]